MKYNLGDCIIYQKHKVSVHPGPRAEDIFPAPNGDSYSYQVKKFWRISSIIDDNTVEVITRRRKRHRLNVKDPNIKKPGPIFQFIYRQDFPQLEKVDSQNN